jgi:hypothetical protein
MTRLSAWIKRVTAWLSEHRLPLRRWGIVLSVILFAGGLYLAVEASPGILHRIDLVPFLMLFGVSAVLQPLLNAAEFRVMVEYGGRRIDWLTSLEVTVYTSASNLLPLPGGVVTRMAAMHGYGVGVGKGGRIIILALVVWGGAAAVYSGIWLMGAGAALIGGAFTAGGLAGLVFAVVLCRALNPSWRLMGKILAVRIAALVVEAARMTLAILALGDQVAFNQASVLVVSSFVGTVVAVAPSGLGVREATVAALSPFIGIDPATGFLAATVNRMAGILGLVCVAGVVLALMKSHLKKPHQTVSSNE